MSTRLVSLVALGALTLGLGCSDNATAPNFASLTLSLSTTAVPVSGTTTITARLADLSGQPVPDGTTVTFSCCSGQITGTTTTPVDSLAAPGTITPAQGTTVGGVVIARFTAGSQSGTARVVAYSTSAASRVVDILIGAAAAKSLVLTANPVTIPMTGGTVDLTATAVDSAGNGVAGVPVTFVANAGTLSTSTATTGSSGQAVVHLTTTRETIVTASIGTAATQTTTLTVKLLSTPSISVTANPTSPVAGQSAQFVYTLGVPAGSAALGTLVVDFGDSTTSTLTGLAATTYVGHVYANPGVYTVRSTVSDVAGVSATASMVLVVQPRPVLLVSINPPAAGAVLRGVPAVLGVTVTPTTELPRVVRYEWDFGDGGTAVATSATVGHTFVSTGTQLVNVTVVTSDGLRVSAQATVLVKDP